MGEREQAAIEVLLHEYDTLRAEILQRVQNRFALLAVTAAAGAVLAERGLSGGWSLVPLGVVFAAALVWAYMWMGIERCTARVRVLEQTINRLLVSDAVGNEPATRSEDANPPGSMPYLAWETIQGDRRRSASEATGPTAWLRRNGRRVLNRYVLPDVFGAPIMPQSSRDAD